MKKIYLLFTSLTVLILLSMPAQAQNIIINQLNNGVSSPPLPAGTTNAAVLGFSAKKSGGGTPVLTAVTIQTSTTTVGKLSNFRLVRSVTDNDYLTFADNVNVGGVTINVTATQVQITGLSQNLSTGAINYFLIADVAASVTVATPAVMFTLSNTGITAAPGTIGAFSFSSPNFTFTSAACDGTVPTFNVNLTGQPAGVYLSPNIQRLGQCCGRNGGPPDNIVCVSFIVTLDVNAQGIRFDIASGAQPGGALDFQINCGPIYPVGVDICLDGIGPHVITFCKPGNNKNEYQITSIAKPTVTPPVTVSNGCSTTLSVTDVVPASVTWTSVPFNATHNSYLSCLSGCTTTTATYQAGAPDSVLYAVQGTPIGGCSSSVFRDTTWVYFVNDKFVNVPNGVICFGGTNATLTAFASGGKPPYSYLWSTGATTQSITVGVGTYSIIVSDNSGCPPGLDTVQVTANPSPVTVNAGPDQSICRNNAVVQLAGAVVQARRGRWSCASCTPGQFSPNDSTLNATFTPTAAQLAAGTLTLTLSSVGHDPCPLVTDQMVITFTNIPVVNSGPNQTACSNNSTVSLTGSVTNAGGGRWTSSIAGGVFFPNDSTLTATYAPPSGFTGPFVLTLTSIQNGNCLPITDTTGFFIYPAPTLNPLTPQTVCANNAAVSFTAVATNQTSVAWTSANGSFAPSNALATTFTPNAAAITAGTASVTVTVSRAGCNNVSQSTTVTIQPSPTVNPGGNRTVCANSPTVNLNGTATNYTTTTWSSANGTFGNASNLVTTFTPNAAAITAGTANVTLCADRAGCAQVCSTFVLTITTSPTIDAGTAGPVCANNATVSLSGSVTVATGGTWSGGTGTFANANALTTTYTPSATETSGTFPKTVKLYLTSTGNGSCIQVRDSVSFTITAPPTVNAGADQTVCANNAAVAVSGTVTIATGGTWTTSGTGTFANANALATTYTPSAADITAGTVTLTLTTTGNGLCNSVNDQLVVTISPAPTVDAGANQTVCANNAQVCLSGTVTNATSFVWTRSGTGTFNNANSLTACYTPSAADITAGTVTLTLTATRAGCTNVTDNMVITITPRPTVNPGDYTPECSNNAVINLTGSVTVATGGVWSNNGGGGTFNPSNSLLTTQYIPSAAEIASFQAILTLTTTGNGNCLPVDSTVVIQIIPAPTVNAGTDQVRCKNNNVVTLAGTITDASGGAIGTINRLWTTSGTGTFSNATSLTSTYTPSAADLTAGTVTLTLTATTPTFPCNAVSDFMTITFTDSPTVNAGPDRTVCANNSLTTLNGAVTIATGGTWSSPTGGTFPGGANNLNTTYQPTATDISNGTVTLTLTSTGNGTCNAVSDVLVVTITPAPTANAGSDQTVCANRSTVTLNGSVTVATGGSWTTSGTGTFIPNANTLNAQYLPSNADTTAGTVTLTLTTTGNGNCNSVSDAMVVTITPAPLVDAGTSAGSCANNPTVSLSGYVAVATGGIWTGGAGTFSPNNTSLATTYTPSAGEITAGTVTLTLTTTGNGNCNSLNDQITFPIVPAPIVSAGADQTVCGAVASVTLNGSVTNATGGTWTTSGTGTFSNANALNASYTPSAADKAATTVTLTLTSTGNGTCNAVTDQMVITFTAVPTVNAGPDQTVCSNDFPIQLAGSGSSSNWTGGAGTFTPSRSVLNPTYTPAAGEIGGTVTLTLTTVAFGACASINDQVILTIPAGPVVNAGTNQTLCGDRNNVSLSGSVTNAGGGIWTTVGGTGSFNSNTSLTPTYTFSALDKSNQVVTFVLTSTGNGSCSAERDTVVVTLTTAPTIDAGPDFTICADKANINLVATVTVATGGTWTTSGTGTFGNANALTTTYTPSAADRSAGVPINICITSTGNGTCNPVQNCMVLNITPAPTANAGANQTVCADDPSITLAGSVTIASGGVWSTPNGTGTFSSSNSILNATYNITPNDTVVKNIIIILTTTGNGTCNAVTDTMMLNITPVPVVNPGANQTVCGDVGTVTLNGTVRNASGGTWTTNGTGTFANANNLSTTYTPSANDIAAGQVTLTLTSTGNGTCNAVSQNLILNITPIPSINAGPDLTVCADDPTVDLTSSVTIASGGVWSTSNGGGTFTPSNNVLNPTYNIVPNDTIIKNINICISSTGNGTCNAVQDCMVLTITPKPIVNAGADDIVCSTAGSVSLNGSISHATGGIWSSTGTGTFSPNAVTLNASYIPSNADKTAGSVTLTLTTTGNGNCNAYTDTKLVTFAPAPVVDAGAANTICADASSITLAPTVSNTNSVLWTTSGTGTFSPNATTLNASYVPSATDISNGFATLTLTGTGDALCAPVSDNVLITITPAPTVDAGGDRTICADVNQVTLNGTVTIATGGTWSILTGSGSFSPNANSLTVDYILSNTDKTNGTVSLILTTTGNGTCNPVKDTVTITITPAPTINAGTNQTICADANSVTLDATVTTATGGVWTSTGTGTFSPDANTVDATYLPSALDKNNGIVTLTITSTGNGTCAAVNDNMVITITPAPTVNAGIDQSICEDGTVTLNGVITVSTGGIWTTGSGTGTFTPNATTLNATFTPSSFQINNGLATLTLTTTGNGTCNAVDDKMFVNIQKKPVVDAGAAQNVCASVNSVQLNGTVTNATGGTWVTSGTGTFSNANILNPVYTPSANDKIAGSIKLTLTSTGNGQCSAEKDSTFISFSPTPTVNAGNATLCASQGNISLTATSTVASGVLWTTTGTGTFSPATALTTTYTTSALDNTNGSVKIYVTTTGNGPCAAVRDSIQVTISPIPNANAGADMITCANVTTVNLSGSVTGATGGLWSSLNGGTFGNVNNLNTTYIISALDITKGKAVVYLTTTGVAASCTPHKDSLEIIITPAPIVNAGANDTICADNTATISGSVTTATGGTWTTNGDGTFANANSLTTVYTPGNNDKTNGTVTLTLTSTGNGLCTAVTDQTVLTITPAPTISLGPDQSYCSDISAFFVTATTTVATGATWTTTGSGTITVNGADSRNIQYTIGATDFTTFPIQFVATTTGVGTCNIRRDTVLVSFTPAPTLTVTPTDICTSRDTVSLSSIFTVSTGVIWTTSNTTSPGTFTPSATSANTGYIVSASDKSNGTVTITATTTGNGTCTAISKSANVVLVPTPTVDAGANQTICADDRSINLTGAITNASGAVWSTSGTGTFGNANSLNTTYATSDADTASNQVILYLSTTGTGICPTLLDSMILTITPAPIIDAGPAIVCGNNPVINLNASVHIATGGTWSTSGNGTFGNVNNLSTTYTLGTNDTSSGTVTLTITSTGNGTCNPVTDNIVINVAASPQANAEPNKSVCKDATTVSVTGTFANATGIQWTSSSGGTFANSTATTTNYNINATDTANGSVTIYLATTGNGICLPTVDSLIVTLTPTPTINIGTATICIDRDTVQLPTPTLTIATGVIWSTTTGGTFLPTATTLNPRYVFSNTDKSNGIVRLVATTTGMGTCNPVRDTITINLTPPPTAEAGATQTLCATTSTVTLNGVITGIADPLWSLVPGFASGTLSSTNTLNTTYNVNFASDTARRVVKLVLSTTNVGTCIPKTDTVTINFTPRPLVSTGGGTMSVCADLKTIPLPGSSISSGSNTWTLVSGSGSFAPNTANGNYIRSSADSAAGTIKMYLTATATGACVNDAVDTLTITITPAPTVDAGPATICADNTSVPVSGTVTVATGGTWTTSSTSGGFFTSPNSLSTFYVPSNGDRTAGQVTLYLSTTGNGTCNSVKDSLVLNITPPPSVTASAITTTFCSDIDSVKVSATVVGTAGVLWSSSSGSTSFVPNATSLNTTYLPTTTDKNNGTVTLHVITTGVGTCIPREDSVVITFTPAPNVLVNAGADDSVCAETNSYQLNGQISVATGGQWTSTGSGVFVPDATTLNAVYQPSVADTAAGSITLTLTTTGNGLCTPVSDNMVLTFIPAPLINAGPDQNVCADTPIININGSVSGGSGFWITGGSGTFGNANALTTTYTISAGDIQDSIIDLTLSSPVGTGCAVVTDNIRLFVKPIPIVNTVAALTMCADQGSINITGNVQNATGGQWTTTGSGTFANDTLISTSYTPSNADTTAGTVTLTLNATGIGSCNAVSSDIVLTINPAPFLEAGADQTICADERKITLSPTLMHISGGQWSTNGTGSFSPSFADNDVTYSVTDADTATANLIFVYNSLNTNGCNDYTDTVRVTITPTPKINAGADQVICADSSAITISGTVSTATGGVWQTSGSGTFADSTSLSTTYTPSASDITTGTVILTIRSTGNGSCNAVTDQMQLTITPAPTINAGADQTVCADASSVSLFATTTVASGVQWGTTGGGTFTSPNTFATNYTIAPSDTVTKVIKIFATSTGNGTCFPVSDTLTLNITPAPVVNSGAAITVCADVTSVPLTGTASSAVGGIIWTSNGTGTFVPDEFRLNVDYVPSAQDITNGTVGITLASTSAGTCNNVSSVTTITFTPAPTVTTQDTVYICADEASATISATITTATGVSWSTSGTGTFSSSTSLVTDYTPSATDISSGIVILTAVTTGNGTCNSVESKTVLRITPAPTIDAGLDQTVCEDQGSVQLDGTVTVAGGAIWTTSGTGSFFINENTLAADYNFSINDVNAGSVVLKLTSTNNGRCQAVSDSVVIDFVLKPIVVAGGADICVDEDGIDLSGTVTNASGGVWATTGTGVFSPNEFDLNATYVPSQADMTSGFVKLILTSTGNSICSVVSDTINANISPKPEADGGNDMLICRNDAATLMAATAANLTYSWQTTTGTQISASEIATITASTDTSFVLVVTDAKGCINTDTVNVLVTDPPVFNLADQICYEPNLLLDSDPSGTILGDFQWFVNDTLVPQANDETLIIDRGGIFDITYTFGSCKVSDSINVTLPPMLNADDVVVCENSTASVNANSPTGTVYSWTNSSGSVISNNTNASVNVTTGSEIVFVEVTDGLGCKTKDTVNIGTVPPPALTLENVPACEGETVRLSAFPSNISDSTNFQYIWYKNGSNLNIFTSYLEVLEEGLYKVRFNIGQCFAEDSSEVKFNPHPTTNADDTLKNCFEDIPTLEINAGEGAAYEWEESKTTNRVDVISAPGTYYVKVFNEFNCYTRDSVYVYNACPPRVFPPNSFTPNGDGTNDFFQVFGANYANFKITIFNRWGEIIYYSEDPFFKWDGTYRNEPMPIGVYPFTIQYGAEFKEFDTGLKILNGSVTIVR